LGAYAEKTKVEFMNTNSEQQKSMKSFVLIGKPVLLNVGVAFVFLLSILSLLKLFIFNSLAIMLAVYSVIAFVISITVLVFQKRASVNSILGLIIGILFIFSSLIYGYSHTLSFPKKIYTSQIGSGFSLTGLGLTFVAFSLVLFGLTKLGMISKLKYSKFLMAFLFIWGLFPLAVGIYNIVSGCWYLLNG
jgi:hypothetical protein